MSLYKIPPSDLYHHELFGNLVLTCADPNVRFAKNCIELVQSINFPPPGSTERPLRAIPPLRRTQSCISDVPTSNPENEKRRASALLDELLLDIYTNVHNGTTDYYSTSGKSQRSVWIEVVDLQNKSGAELRAILQGLREHIARTGSVLVRHLKRRDALRRQQQAHCDAITRLLEQRASNPVPDMRFTIQPVPGDSGFSQWVAAMKMVAQLPGGIPPEFRRRLWITMAGKHLVSRGIDWAEVEKTCFSEWSHPADAELGIQIVKDLHRTGCSLFCGEDGLENQALLKKVLLAYARWNKAVGYCQGFNMLAALILQVTDRCETDALKLMIYLIEGVLPDSYFADSLRGLSVDMAVFRELLRSKLPRLSKHLDMLQNTPKEGSRSYEPPLTNVFTMQWFLTLFCNCLPQPTVLRVWDLIFLEGNEILLRTALAIWQVLAQRILVARTADEFYCVMGSLTRELLESNLIDANTLIKTLVAIGPLAELKSLRDHYLYNITPWGTALPQVENKINLHPKHSIPLDINALKKQYLKLKQRQKQAHVIFSTAISRAPSPASPAINHLLIGKKALGPARRLGPIKGSIPPARQTQPSTLQWKDTEKQRQEQVPSSSSSSDTELCDDDDAASSSETDEKVPGSSQFEDNLQSAGDIIYSDDNIAPSSENVPFVDNLCTSPVNIKLTSDSEDDSVDFEHFLADRVKCLKESESGHSSGLARRNSELALQIIQENSLILHRIMQCQSRLSPSPPLLFDESQAADPVEISTSDPTESEKMEQVTSWIDSCDLGAPTESRYHSILEKSKSLDERYNNLFSTDSGLPESKSDTPIALDIEGLYEHSDIERKSSTNDSQDTLILPSISDDGSKLIQENLDVLKAVAANKRSEKSQKLIQENVSLLESITIERQTTLVEKDSGISLEKTAELSEINVTDPNCEADDCCDKSLSLNISKDALLTLKPNDSNDQIDKSPSRAFNPFPIPFSSRQNKEVPLKLGLYKK